MEQQGLLCSIRRTKLGKYGHCKRKPESLKHSSVDEVVKTKDVEENGMDDNVMHWTDSELKVG